MTNREQGSRKSNREADFQRGSLETLKMKSIEVVRVGFGTRRSSEAPKFGTIAHQYLVCKTVLGVLIVDLLPLFSAFFQKRKKKKRKSSIL